MNISIRRKGQYFSISSLEYIFVKKVISTYLNQTLKDAQQHHVLESRFGRDGQQHV